MKPRIAVVVVLALLFALPCLAAESLVVKGKVVDLKGRPVKGIKVYVVASVRVAEPKSYVKAAVTTSADGKFEFKPVKCGPDFSEISLVASASNNLGWSVYPLGSWSDRAIPLLKDVTIVVSKPAAVEGRIVGEEGEPISGVTIDSYSLSSKDGPVTVNSYLQSACLSAVIKFPKPTTDKVGRFRIPSIPEHMKVCINPVKEHYASKPGQYGAALDLNHYVMLPGGELSGRVMYPSGKPAVGLAISAQERQNGGGSGGYTAKDGSFKVMGLLPGSYELNIYGNKGYQLTAILSSFYVKAGIDTDAGSISLPKQVTITGRVLDIDSGKPVANAEIAADGEKWRGYAKADANGVYKLTAASGSCRVYYERGNPLYYPDMTNIPAPITVPEAGLQGCDIKIKKSDIAQCLVVDSKGKPVAGATVSVGDPSFGGADATTDKNGKVTVVVPQEKQGGG